MRISDWSSDVCSSDLRVDAADQRALLARARQQRLGLDVRRGAGHARIGAGLGDGDLPVLHRLAAGGDGGVRGHLQHAVADRSEEHTSELQSLMRISYAVFCLKKKKIHKTRLAYPHYTTKHQNHIHRS